MLEEMIVTCNHHQIERDHQRQLFLSGQANPTIPENYPLFPEEPPIIAEEVPILNEEVPWYVEEVEIAYEEIIDEETTEASNNDKTMDPNSTDDIQEFILDMMNDYESPN